MYNIYIYIRTPIHGRQLIQELKKMDFFIDF